MNPLGMKTDAADFAMIYIQIDHYQKKSQRLLTTPSTMKALMKVLFKMGHALEVGITCGTI